MRWQIFHSFGETESFTPVDKCAFVIGTARHAAQPGSEAWKKLKSLNESERISGTDSTFVNLWLYATTDFLCMPRSHGLTLFLDLPKPRKNIVLIRSVNYMLVDLGQFTQVPLRFCWLDRLGLWKRYIMQCLDSSLHTSFIIYYPFVFFLFASMLSFKSVKQSF